MNDDHSWKLYVTVIGCGLIAGAFVLGIIMGRISWPFDLIMRLVGT